MKVELMKKVLQAFEVCSKDETRLRLCGVCIRHLGGKEFEVVGTDGFSLFRYYFEDDDLPQSLTSEVIIKNEKANKEMLKYGIKMNQEVLIGSLMLLENREYPKTSVFTPPKSSTIEIGMQASNLKRVIASLEKKGTIKDQQLIFNITTALKPIYITTESQRVAHDKESFRVIMPFKVSEVSA